MDREKPAVFAMKRSLGLEKSRMHNGIRSKIHEDAKGCRKMIILMIKQALEDIKQGRSTNYKHNLDWHHAYNWILSDSFEIWCSYVDFDHEAIRERVVKEMNGASVEHFSDQFLAA